MILNSDADQPFDERCDGTRSQDTARHQSGINRREFFGVTAASLLFARTLDGSAASEGKNGIPYRPLGHTGEKVSLIGLGGYHLARQRQVEESIRIIRTGLDEGINFLDNCWDYNGGESEVRMGKALRDGYPEGISDDQDRWSNQECRDSSLNESLRRLQTDRVDLLQFHEVIRDSDPGRVLPKVAQWGLCLRPKRRAKSALSDSLTTRVQAFI